MIRDDKRKTLGRIGETLTIRTQKIIQNNMRQKLERSFSNNLKGKKIFKKR